MPTAKDTLKAQLSRFREITITVVGRKSGKKISRPVWFVNEGDTLYLLPVQGSDTQWYKNLLQNPEIGIETRDTQGKFHATEVTDRKTVASVADKFREKYTAADVKKYYSKFDVAVTIHLD